ncbi:CaiB/BaiF CoA transferase family protein [Bacillus marinisedimentorum]|uniref:CaiB/BaiF CoA transferase family protein n=1 Tax=Bacillus marinisedimentorum TaxID=1821260 RepID=UPI0007E03606|nr:CaiB/BaiF CoA-transferase family protein [Bacillus marinisedimentorum]
MLEGIRVLDFSQYLPGPSASLRLADMGAEVIKVESPAGDLARSVGGSSQENTPVFRLNNSGKKSVVVNLKEREERERILNLIKTADVLIESFRPGVMRRLGLDYESTGKVKRNLIYCSISGYGQDGEFSRLGSHDLNYMAVSGMLSQFKDSKGRPVHPTVTLADMAGGMAASEAITAALFKRERTGEGSYIDLALIDGMAAFLSHHYTMSAESGIETGIEPLNGQLVSYHLYETADGRFVSLAALEPKFWRSFCEAAGKEEWLSAHLSPADSSNPVYADIQSFFLSKTMKEWRIFGETVDCCLIPVLEPGEASAHPLLKERGLARSGNGGGVLTATGYGRPAGTRGPSPELGEHTEEVLGMLPVMKIREDEK